VKTGTSLTIIAVGAILAFAVNGHPSWLDIQVVGWVVMATGAAGLLIPGRGYAAVRRRIVRRRTGPGGPVTEVDEQTYPPYIKLNSRSVTEPGLIPGEDPGDLVSSTDEMPTPRGQETVTEYLSP
jgi:hypothetical protein